MLDMQRGVVVEYVCRGTRTTFLFARLPIKGCLSVRTYVACSSTVHANGGATGGHPFVVYGG
jgi:hypothetical protein